MSNINILMVGPSRSGKSSILSSMLNSTHDHNGVLLKNKLSITGHKKDSDGDFDTAEAMKSDLNFMQEMAEKKNRSLGAYTGTRQITEYKFTLSFNDGSNNGSDCQFSFYDIVGETYDPAHEQFSIVKKLAENSQVMLIAVDTPAFNVAKDSAVSYKNMVTCIPALDELIKAFAVNVQSNAIDTPKLVVFVPIKCEKELRNPQNKKQLYKDIEDVYKNNIIQLKSKNVDTPFENLKVLIMPIETIGNVYHERTDWETNVLVHSSNKDKKNLIKTVIVPKKGVRMYKTYEDEQLINEKDAKPRCFARCHIVGEEGDVVHLFNGERIHIDKDNGDEILNANSFPKNRYLCHDDFEGIGCVIPYYWYKANPNEKYSPKNCDQLFMEILKFIVQNIAISSKKTMNDLINGDTGFFQKIINIFKKLRGMPITVSQLTAICRTLRNMKDNNLFTGDYYEVFNSLDDEKHKNMQL